MMPEFEEQVIDWFIEWVRRQEIVLFKWGDDCVAFLDPIIYSFGCSISSSIEFIQHILVVALQTDTLHARLILFPHRSAFANRGKQVPGETVTDIVGGDTQLDTGDIVAAGEEFHPTLLEVTRAAFG